MPLSSGFADGVTARIGLSGQLWGTRSLVRILHPIGWDDVDVVQEQTAATSLLDAAVATRHRYM